MGTPMWLDLQYLIHLMLSSEQLNFSVPRTTSFSSFGGHRLPLMTLDIFYLLTAFVLSYCAHYYCRRSTVRGTCVFMYVSCVPLVPCAVGTDLLTDRDLLAVEAWLACWRQQP